MQRPAAVRPSLTITSQYLKDLSFESPHLPSYRTLDSPAREKSSFGLQINQVTDTTFEVALVVSGITKRAEVVGFMVEFIYAGLFDLRNFPPEHRDAALHIEAPELLFPFARKILANLLRINGFPLTIPPAVDFVRRYAGELTRARQNDPRFA